MKWGGDSCRVVRSCNGMCVLELGEMGWSGVRWCGMGWGEVGLGKMELGGVTWGEVHGVW